MSIEIGEARNKWGMDVWNQAEEIAQKTDSQGKPFYLVYAAKHDPHESQRRGRGAYRQTFKAYYKKPPKLLGILVWYADKEKGIFEFKHELSSPPDVPLDPKLLSEKAEDASPRVMEKGKEMNVLLS